MNMDQGSNAVCRETHRSLQGFFLPFWPKKLISFLNKKISLNSFSQTLKDFNFKDSVKQKILFSSPLQELEVSPAF